MDVDLGCLKAGMVVVTRNKNVYLLVEDKKEVLIGISLEGWITTYDREGNYGIVEAYLPKHAYSLVKVLKLLNENNIRLEDMNNDKRKSFPAVDYLRNSGSFYEVIPPLKKLTVGEIKEILGYDFELIPEKEED